MRTRACAVRTPRSPTYSIFKNAQTDGSDDTNCQKNTHNHTRNAHIAFRPSAERGVGNESKSSRERKTERGRNERAI
eukprot:6196777-Pleurochrysis_carterae.AAC.4